MSKATAFTDTKNHWAKESIDFAAARGLFKGIEDAMSTGKDKFSPDTGMTRGIFVTALGRLAGVDPTNHTINSFTDVDTTKYYAPYTAWAVEKGIVNGTSRTTFSPDAVLTRQEMAVIMVNYAKAMGYALPRVHAELTFADSGSIAKWARASVKSMQMAGVMADKDGNRFDPAGIVTRGEACAVLHRFVELVIDQTTAQGWMKNDSGHWHYYKDGRKLTGWQTVDGRWYYFHADGAMAVNTKIDGYEIGPDGARKEEG